MNKIDVRNSIKDSVECSVSDFKAKDVNKDDIKNYLEEILLKK